MVSNTGCKRKVERSDPATTALLIFLAWSLFFRRLLQNDNRFCPSSSLLTDKPVSGLQALTSKASSDLECTEVPTAMLRLSASLRGAHHCIPCVSPAGLKEPCFVQRSGRCCSWDAQSAMEASFSGVKCPGWMGWNGAAVLGSCRRSRDYAGESPGHPGEVPLASGKLKMGTMRRWVKAGLNCGHWPVLNSVLCFWGHPCTVTAQGGTLHPLFFFLVTCLEEQGIYPLLWHVTPGSFLRLSLSKGAQHSFWKTTALPCFLGFHCLSASILLHRRRELTGFISVVGVTRDVTLSWRNSFKWEEFQFSR